MRQKIVGVYDMGLDQVQLVLREGEGGEFWFKPEDGHVPRIKVGADGEWKLVMSALLHEAMEMQMTRSHCRFNPAPDYGRDHSSYIFVMSHPIYSDIIARVAEFVSLCAPDLARAYKKFRR